MDRYVLLFCSDVFADEIPLISSVLQQLPAEASRYKDIHITKYFGEASQQVYTTFVHPSCRQATQNRNVCKQAESFASSEKVKWEKVPCTDNWKIPDTFQEVLDGSWASCYPAHNDCRAWLAEQLHVVGNNLPYTGYLLDIIWMGNIHFSIESNFALFGALQRLVVSHKGVLTLLHKDGLSADGQEWLEALDGTSCPLEGSTCLLMDTVWRGSVTFHNSKSGDFVSLPGLSLCPVGRSDSCGQYSVTVSDHRVTDQSGPHYGAGGRKRKQQPPVLAMSPHLVFLDEVMIEEIPIYMLTNNKFKLSISTRDAASRTFIERVNKREKFGTIVRLTYGNCTDPPVEDLRVDTHTWMKRVINNVTAEDTVTKLSGTTDYHNFLLVSADDNPAVNDSSADNTSGHVFCYGYLMRKPSEINGAVIDDLNKISRRRVCAQSQAPEAERQISTDVRTEINFASALRKSGIIHDRKSKSYTKSESLGECGLLRCPNTPENESESKTRSKVFLSLPRIEQQVRDLLSDLPQYAANSLIQLETRIADTQILVLKNWIESRQSDGLSTRMTYSELLYLLREVRKDCLKLVEHQGSFPKTSLKDVKLEFKEIFSELTIEPDQWQERTALVHVENAVKIMQRYKSTDSLGGLMPPAKDDSVSLDVCEFLKYFKADGRSVADNLKPVHVGSSKPSIQVDGSLDPLTLSSMEWPEVKRRCYHDMYYNSDSTASEKKQEKADRIRGRYIGNETGSTCNAHQRNQPITIAQLTSAAKREKEKDFQKEQEKKLCDGTKKEKKTDGSKFNSCRGRSDSKFSRKAAGDDKDDISSCATPGQAFTRKRKILVPVKQADKKEEACPSKVVRSRVSRKEIPITQADIPVQTSQPTKRVSRSERHKRKLEEIVTATLENNGIPTDHSLYSSCRTRLYKLTKMYVMDLTTSRNLKEEMKKIAEDHVKQVISFEMKRTDSTAP